MRIPFCLAIISALAHIPQSTIMCAAKVNTAEYSVYSTKAPKIKLSRELKKDTSEVKQLRDKLLALDKKYSVITQERLRLIKAPSIIDMNGLKKSQFETNHEYSLRIASVKQQNSLTLQKFNSQRASVFANIKFEKAKDRNSIYARISTLTTKEYHLKNIKVSLGFYNAVEEYFDASLPQFPYHDLTVPVDISIAKAFKANFSANNSAIIGINEVGDLILKSVAFEQAGRVYYGNIEYSKAKSSEYNDNKPVIASSERALLAPGLELTAVFVDPNGNGYLDANEQARFNVSIKNNGDGDALGVLLKARLNIKATEITYDPSRYVGNIPKGEMIKVQIHVSASSKVTVNQLAMGFSAKESNGFNPNPIEILFESKPLILPDLGLVDYGLSTATGENIIRPGVRSDIQIRIQNKGQGYARNINFKLITPSNVFFYPGSKKEYNDIQLGPGKYKDLEFSFTCNNNVGSTVDFKIDYKESHTKGSLPLSLEVDKAQQSIKQFTVSKENIAQIKIKDVSTISVDVEQEIPKAKSVNKKAIGVVFGIENYKEISDVTFAARDAKWIYKYFQDVLGIPKNRIYFKTNSDVSKAEFDKVLLNGGWIDKRVVTGETEVYFYYAGHGAPDIKQNKAYLIPYDGDPNYASQTGINLDDVYSRLNDIEAKSVTVFLDACFSGANRNNEMLLAGARPVFIDVDANVAGGITVFSAASAREISSAWPEKKHGLFSYFLMKGMQGSADINDDRQITIGELGEYIKENVPEMAGMLDREQTPELQSMNPEQVLIQF